jgi:hypothetical protein
LGDVNLEGAAMPSGFRDPPNSLLISEPFQHHSSRDFDRTVDRITFKRTRNLHDRPKFWPRLPCSGNHGMNCRNLFLFHGAPSLVESTYQKMSIIPIATAEGNIESSSSKPAASRFQIHGS